MHVPADLTGKAKSAGKKQLQGARKSCGSKDFKRSAGVRGCVRAEISCGSGEKQRSAGKRLFFFLRICEKIKNRRSTILFRAPPQTPLGPKAPDPCIPGSARTRPRRWQGKGSFVPFPLQEVDPRRSGNRCPAAARPAYWSTLRFGPR